MYHLSGISSLTNGSRIRSNDPLAVCPSTPLSPSVLDFSEYVSRQCEKKLQQRVRQLTQRSNRQLATIQKLKRQLATSRPHSRRSSKTIVTMLQTCGDSGKRAEETVGKVEQVEQAEAEEEVVEGHQTEEVRQTPQLTVLDGETETEDRSAQAELEDSLLSPREEGEQLTSAQHAELTDDIIGCPPCSPISLNRHKRTRTDDSEQCNTELIDAQWKKAKETEDHQLDHNEPLDPPTAVTTLSAPSSPVCAVGAHTLLPFKPALLYPFGMSHSHLQGNSAGAVLTPYRGLLRPFPLAQHSQHSPLRISQPEL